MRPSRILRGLCGGAAGVLAVTALATVTTPAAQAAGPAIPDPSSSVWTPLTKGGQVATDAASDAAAPHLDLVATGGVIGPAAAFVHADADHVYFRVTVDDAPDGAAGSYVVQVDGNTLGGYEAGVAYSDAADSITVCLGDDDKVDSPGTECVETAETAANARRDPAPDGKTFVAWAVTRDALESTGMNLAFPVRFLVGTTTTDESPALLRRGCGLVGACTPTADILGYQAYNQRGLLPSDPAPALDWNTLALDELHIDGPPGPGGPDTDGDGVPDSADKCPELPGSMANGCRGQVVTYVSLKYRAKVRRFVGAVRADYRPCLPQRRITVYRQVKGPDVKIGTARTRSTGRYVVAHRARKGAYYAQVARSWTELANCFGRKSPLVRIR